MLNSLTNSFYVYSLSNSDILSVYILVFLAKKKKVNFINSSQNEGLSPSCIALSFDRFGSI
jgi:hypothetical protein